MEVSRAVLGQADHGKTLVASGSANNQLQVRKLINSSLNKTVELNIELYNHYILKRVNNICIK